MTAPTLPREDQAVGELFDIELLERHADDDVRCECDDLPKCDKPATHILVLKCCGGSCFVCQKDAMELLEAHERTRQAFLGVTCATCNARYVGEIVRPL